MDSAGLFPPRTGVEALKNGGYNCLYLSSRLCQSQAGPAAPCSSTRSSSSSRRLGIGEVDVLGAVLIESEPGRPGLNPPGGVFLGIPVTGLFESSNTSSSSNSVSENWQPFIHLMTSSSHSRRGTSWRPAWSAVFNWGSNRPCWVHAGSALMPKSRWQTLLMILSTRTSSA